MREPSRQGLAGTFRLRQVRAQAGSHTILDCIDLDLAVGEAVALVGPSGAGKTTLLKLLNSTFPASSGTVESCGLDLANASPHALEELRSRIGFVHQDLALVPNVRVLQNVLSGRLGRSSWIKSLPDMWFPRQSSIEAVYEILQQVGIEQLLFRRTDSLSGGEQQRVAVARALFQEPVALLADEPVASVDPERALRTITLLKELSRHRGLTLVVSLHDLDLAWQFFPRLIGLRNGRVVFDRRTQDIDRAHLHELYSIDGRSDWSEGKA